MSHNSAKEESPPASRLMVPLAVVTAAAILVGWLPLSALWHQQSQIDAARTQIHALQSEESSLTTQAKSLDSVAAATQLAREQYQLVSPGQSLIQVLPGNAAGAVTAQSVDPGYQPLVPPSGTLPVATATANHPFAGGFLSRLVGTLEFWR